MKRVALENTPKTGSQYFSTTLNDRCGFVIVKEGSRRLLWVTLNGKLEFFSCSTLNELLGILQREDLVQEFAAAWNAEEGNEEPFEGMWQTVLSDIRDQCGRWDADVQPLVPERVKKQLLWAFDTSGNLDGDRFVTILKYERVHLTPLQLVELASELTTRPRKWMPAPSKN